VSRARDKLEYPVSALLAWSSDAVVVQLSRYYLIESAIISHTSIFPASIVFHLRRSLSMTILVVLVCRAKLCGKV